MISEVSSVAFLGLDVQEVKIQTQISSGLPAFNIIGLVDKSISESRERVRAALNSLGMNLPAQRITVSLSPADLPKEGSYFDLPIAISILVAIGVVDQEAILNTIIVGELSLNGRINKAYGLLGAAIYAKSQAMALICPKQQLKQASFSGNNEITATDNLIELISYLKDGTPILSASSSKEPDFSHKKTNIEVDFKDIIGQNFAKRALQIAAIGGHNIMMIGSAGSGKSLLAKAFATIISPMNVQQSLETSLIHSIANQIDDDIGIVYERPFRSPHHSTSSAAIIGGGPKACPGEISLAHNGVLFLDEMPEFKADVLEALRVPLEDKNITVSRVNHKHKYPANFQLIAALNPCKCGYLYEPELACRQAPICGERYLNKISNPILDRIDIIINVPQMKTREIIYPSNHNNLSSAEIRKQVIQIQQNIYHRNLKLFKKSALNSELNTKEIQHITELDQTCKTFLEQALQKLKISTRSYLKILKLARTIADVENSKLINKKHISEAISYRRNLRN